MVGEGVKMCVRIHALFRIGSTRQCKHMVAAVKEEQKHVNLYMGEH